mmetsp:Transcript_42695/g.92837  ORF Transcript_42695/g.92837 Transcript_42695/m.92837 type:complete len:230 (-) Transcript_42695:363-1052(-)
MMISSVWATFIVSCIKTPLMTPTAAKPNTPLKRMVSRLKAGLRSSCASRATGTQVPRVIWNIVSILRGNVPKYSKNLISTSMSWSKPSSACKKVMANWPNSNANITSATIRMTDAQKRAPMLCFSAVVMIIKASKFFTVRSGFTKRNRRTKRSSRKEGVELKGISTANISIHQRDTRLKSNQFQKPRKKLLPMPQSFRTTSSANKHPKTNSRTSSTMGTAGQIWSTLSV